MHEALYRPIRHNPRRPAYRGDGSPRQANIWSSQPDDTAKEYRIALSEPGMVILQNLALAPIRGPLAFLRNTPAGRHHTPGPAGPPWL